jgi:hypothetical protein
VHPWCCTDPFDAVLHREALSSTGTSLKRWIVSTCNSAFDVHWCVVGKHRYLGQCIQQRPGHYVSVTALLLNERRRFCKLQTEASTSLSTSSLTSAVDLCSVFFLATEQRRVLKGVTRTVRQKVHTSPLQSWCGHQPAFANLAVPAKATWQRRRSRHGSYQVCKIWGTSLLFGSSCSRKSILTPVIVGVNFRSSSSNWK